MAERAPEHELFRRMTGTPYPCSRWRNKTTGKVYVVSYRSLDEETALPLVSYTDGRGIAWTRKLAVFFEEFEQIDEKNDG